MSTPGHCQLGNFCFIYFISNFITDINIESHISHYCTDLGSNLVTHVIRTDLVRKLGTYWRGFEKPRPELLNLGLGPPFIPGFTGLILSVFNTQEPEQV